jgi:hypothetical protein
MPLPVDFYIEVQNGDKPFYPGQKIEGKVILHCQKQIKPLKIYLTFTGRASVAWTQTTFGRGEVTYFAKEKYFRVEVDLWVRENGQEQLHPGTYEWPFSYKLPLTLPSSCVIEDSHGDIRYWLEAQIDLHTPFRVRYATAQFVFTVLECVDLNLAEEDLTLPRRSEGQKVLCCLCCKSGPLTLAVSTNRGGYCAGENILVTASLENGTNKQIRVIEATLCRFTTFFARNGTGSTHSSCSAVAKILISSRSPAQEVFEWNQNPLLILACPPSSCTCNLIHIQYFLEFVVMTPAFNSNLCVRIPVVIGTQPLRSVYTDTTIPSIGYVESARSVILRDSKGVFKFTPLYSALLPVDDCTDHENNKK